MNPKRWEATGGRFGHVAYGATLGEALANLRKLNDADAPSTVGGDAPATRTLGDNPGRPEGPTSADATKGTAT